MPSISGEEDIARLSAIDPKTLGWPETSYALLERGAERFPDRIALTFLPDPSDFATCRRWTYVELLAEIRRTANLFQASGIGHGGVVAYALPNLPETHFVLWGAEAAGTAMAINPALAHHQISALVTAAGARVLVTTAAIWRALVVAGDVPGSLGHIFLVDGGDEADDRVAPFGPAIAAQPGDRLLGAAPAAEDESSWFCTGGTTGAPKIARRHHSGETGNAMMTAAAIGTHVSADSVFLCGLPLFHVNAAIVTGLVPWSAGAEVVLAGPAGYRDPGLITNFWRIVERYRVSFFSGVPTVYAMLLDQPVGEADISSLDSAVCGAAPMPTDLFRNFEATTGVHILEGYGLTESGCVATLNPIDGERRIGSIGLRLPWQEVLVAELDEAGSYRRDCAPGEIGAILLRGLNVFPGYLDKAQEAELWIERAGEVWMNTGDMGRMDAEGYVWLTGRKKELIIRGGHNIDPAIIEEAMNAHPDITMTAAVGRPDRYSGEVPVAYVQLREGAGVGANDLMAHAAKNVPERAALPKAIHIVEALPQTAVGKIFKPDLVMREIATVAHKAAADLGIDPGAITVRQDPVKRYVVRIEHGNAALGEALSGYIFGVEIDSP